MKGKIKSVFALTLIFFVLLSLFFIPAKASGSHDEKKVMLVIIDRITFEDIGEYPNLSDIARKGSIALMNNRSSGSYSACKSYVSIGSGVRAEGTPAAVGAVRVDEKNARVFYRRTGISVTEGMVVNPDINRLIAQNEKGEYGAIAGNIGYYLRSNGYRTAVIGNGDLENTQIRWGVSIAMDRKGRVDFGKVGDEVLREDDIFPTGRRTDYNAIISYLDSISTKADFIVIETGDLTRIEESRELVSGEMYNLHRSRALERIDDFLNMIREMADRNNWLLMIVTPYPSGLSIAGGDRLTPIIVYGEGYPAGLLISDTTRREGIVGNVDIAATVMEYMEISGEDIVGRPLRGIAADDNLGKIKALNVKTVNTSNFRYPVLRNYAVYVIGVILLGLAAVLYPGIMGGQLRKVVNILIISVMVFPVVLLLIPVFELNTLAATGVSIISAVLTLTLLINSIRTGICNRILVVSLITSTAIVLDIVFGGHLIRSSLLGYDPIIGARYYGIGNEYMGVVTGSTLIAVSAYLKKRENALPIAVIILFGVMIIVGFPGLGANVGGAITCFSAFSFFVIRAKGVRIGLRHILLMLLGLLILVVGFVTMDMLFLESHSHLALAIQEALNKGPAHILGIINRKLSMNIRLLRYTIWTKVLVSVIAATGVLFYRPVGIFKRIFSRYPSLTKGWSAMVVAAAVGMAVNDSGVVTSATSSIFFMMSMLYVFIEESGMKGGAKMSSQITDGV